MNFENKYTSKQLKKSLPHTKINLKTTVLNSSFLTSANLLSFNRTHTYTPDEISIVYSFTQNNYCKQIPFVLSNTQLKNADEIILFINQEIKNNAIAFDFLLRSFIFKCWQCKCIAEARKWFNYFRPRFKHVVKFWNYDARTN